MDNKLLRFYNQNRYLVWIVVLTIVAVIILIHVLNNFLEEKDIEEYGNSGNENTINKQDKNYSVITGKKLKEETASIIQDFIDYCNNGNVDQAYELLSDDCKETLYPDLESFKTNYYNSIFNTKRLYSYQAMISNDNYHTYQINFTEDILATRKNNRK